MCGMHVGTYSPNPGRFINGGAPSRLVVVVVGIQRLRGVRTAGLRRRRRRPARARARDSARPEPPCGHGISCMSVTATFVCRMPTMSRRILAPCIIRCSFLCACLMHASSSSGRGSSVSSLHDAVCLLSLGAGLGRRERDVWGCA